MEKIIIDAENAIVGRLGSVAAKELLKGREVIIINCEKAIISGSKENIVERVLGLRAMGRGGSMKGPKISKLPERLFKRMLRGMLPWDKPKGRQAYKRLRCYVGADGANIKDMKKVKKLNYENPLKFVTIKELSKSL